MGETTVDVLIPVYNAARFVRSAIDSIQRQTLADLRIWVVDDGSTDDTPAILAELAAGDPRIRVLTKANSGIVDALNAGLELCTASFVARHDADDIAYPNRLLDQVAFLDSHPEVVAVSSRARHIDPDGHALGTVAKFQDPERADPTNVPAIEPYLLHPFLMVRRAAIQGAGGYRHVIHAEDTDLYWRLRAVGALRSLPDIQGEYRMHPDSISSQSIRSGRVIGVSSQLCAISAMRRADGRQDLVFSHERGVALKAAAGALEDACAAVEAPLAPEERAHLRFAAGVKLLELADYRPYEIETSDCVFLAKAFATSSSRLRGANRRAVIQSYAGTAARLAAAGRWRDARTLLAPGLLLPFVFRFLFRRLLPASVHSGAQRIARNFILQLKSFSGR